MWLQAVQQVKEIHQHPQSLLLAFLHGFAQLLLVFLHFRVIVDTDELSLERDGVVEGKARSVPEHLWDSRRNEVPSENIRDVCEHEANVGGQRFGEDDRQSGEYITGANVEAWDGAVGEDKNDIDGVDMLLDLSNNIRLVALVSLNTASVGQPRCVEDANLRKRSRIHTMFKNSVTYTYAVGARNFVKAGRVGLTLALRTTFLIGAIENVVADKDISDELQECRLADTGLSNKKDGVWRLNLVLRRFDDPLLERLYIARIYGQN